MKKRLLLGVAALILSFSMIGCSSQGSSSKEDKSLEAIKQKGEFVVGLDDTFAPMGFRDEKGEIVGMDIDLAKEVAKRMGVKAVFKPVEWDGIIMSLNNGDIDLIWNGLSITEKRKEQINYSNPYLTDRQAIIVKKDSSIKSKGDLKNKIVALQMGSTSEDAVQKEPELLNSFKELKKYGNYAEALMDLQIGRVDAVVIDETVGRYYMTKKAGVYTVLNEGFEEQEMGIGFRKSDGTFKDEVNKVLNEMKADGTAKKISEKWLGKDLIEK